MSSASSPRTISDSKETYQCGDLVALNAKELHHLIKVLRLKQGSNVEIFFPNTEKCFLAELVNDKELLLKSELGIKKPRKIHLVVALIKPKLCELIVEKCTELGLSSICFFQAEHYRESATYDLKKQARLEKIRDSALKQSKSFIKTEIKISPNLEQALKMYNTQKGLYLTLEQAPNIIDILSSFNSNLEKSSKSDDLYLVVGPEAGLTKVEIATAISAGAIGVSIGENILRTETASIISAGISICFAWN